MDIYYGIDPSINSTGICRLTYDFDELVSEDFFIIYPNNGKHKLTKRQKEAEESISNFKYIPYEAEDLTIYKDDNYTYEYMKTVNIYNLMKVISDIVESSFKDDNVIHVLQEGISYGSSIRTKSIYDLAGINFLLRSLFINKPHIDLVISPPSNIKKFTTGKGNANKDMMVSLFLSTHRKMEKIPKVDDIADAYHMAIFAKYINEET